MPENTIHLMPDDEILEYMQDLIAGRQPLDAEDLPILIQIPKYNLLTRALQAKIALEDFAAGWVPGSALFQYMELERAPSDLSANAVGESVTWSLEKTHLE